jgi:hypothetical protein|tara:strand:+ start:137 stop:697 length:561 start_codon:yes stop_codon:yes gene_type:complete
MENKTPQIRIEGVRTTRNPQIFQLELRKEQASLSDGSLISMSLGGRAKKYVDWFPVDANFFEAYGYDYDPVTMTIQGNNLFNEHLTRVSDIEISTRAGELFPEEFPVVDLFITETHVKSWDGQKPKMNPSTQEVMCKDNQPIFWNCQTKIANTEDAFDTFIQADGSKQEGIQAETLVDSMQAQLAD